MKSASSDIESHGNGEESKPLTEASGQGQTKKGNYHVCFYPYEGKTYLTRMKEWHTLYLYDNENKRRGQLIPGVELSSDTVKRVLDVIQQRQDCKASRIEGNQECAMRDDSSFGVWTEGHETARKKMKEGREMGSLKKEFSNVKEDLDAFHTWNDDEDYNLMFHASQEDNELAVQALLNLGADPTKINYWGFNVLHLMARKGQIDMARLCIKHLDEDKRKKFINNITNTGLSPLMEVQHIESPIVDFVHPLNTYNLSRFDCGEMLSHISPIPM